MKAKKLSLNQIYLASRAYYKLSTGRIFNKYKVITFFTSCYIFVKSILNN